MGNFKKINNKISDKQQILILGLTIDFYKYYCYILLRNYSSVIIILALLL